MQANLEQNAFRNKSKQIRNNKQNLIMPIVILSVLILVSCALFLSLGINPGSTNYCLLYTSKINRLKIIRNLFYRSL